MPGERAVVDVAPESSSACAALYLSESCCEGACSALSFSESFCCARAS
eukprot:gene18241-biopygen17399